MNLQRCSQGHFYDASKFTQCPHCNATGTPRMNETVSFSTMPIGASGQPTMTVSAQQGNEAQAIMDESEKTIGLFRTETGVEPVVGWLVCIKGRHYGKEFRLRSGRNFIGRGPDMDICLSGEKSVSRDRHAVVVYEPKKNAFVAQAGDSNELSYVNDEVVLSSVEMKKNDIISMGDVKLMLIPCCDSAFDWSKAEQ